MFAIGAVLVAGVAGVAVTRSDGPAGGVALTTVPAKVSASSQDEAPRITAAELMVLVQKNDALLVDVRSESQFAASHAAGAISLPYNSLEARLKELPKEKLIALYCT
jgi:predicted sulfurtransferase